MELKTFLLSLGFSNSKSDSSLFLLHGNGGPIYLLVYVDDIIIIGPSSSHVTELIHSLANLFSLKDLGPLSYFLGVEASMTKLGLVLSQEKYIRDILQETNMLEAKEPSNPLSSIETLRLHDESSLTDATQYRQVIGSMQYLSLT